MLTMMVIWRDTTISSSTAYKSPVNVMNEHVLSCVLMMAITVFDISGHE